MVDGRTQRCAFLAIAALTLAVVCHLSTHDPLRLRLDAVHTPYPAAADPGAVTAPDGESPPRLAERVWLIVVDGLRDDALAAMPALQALARDGVVRTLQAAFPSFTWPGITAFTTGVEPRWSGVRLNGGRVRPPYDTLVAAAARAGVPTVLALDSPEIARLADPRLAPSLPRLSRHDLPAAAPERAFVFVYLDQPDRVGHRHGAASPEYAAVARRVDGELGRLFASIDHTRDAIVVVSDHGHLDRGGHGGTEARARAGLFVAAGAGVGRAAGPLPPARGVDVCPTVAALLGIAPPADNLGRPLLDALAGDRARIAAVWRAQHATAAVRLPHDPDATAAARRRSRVALAGVFAVLALFAWLVPASWRPRPRDFIPVAVYAAVYAGGWLVAGYRWSFSVPRGDARFAIETALLGSCAAAIALAVARAREFGGSPDRAAQRAALVWPLAVVFAAVAAVAGVDPAWLGAAGARFALVVAGSAISWLALALAADAALSAAASARLRRASPPPPATRSG